MRIALCRTDASDRVSLMTNHIVFTHNQTDKIVAAPTVRKDGTLDWDSPSDLNLYEFEAAYAHALCVISERWLSLWEDIGEDIPEPPARTLPSGEIPRSEFRVPLQYRKPDRKRDRSRR